MVASEENDTGFNPRRRLCPDGNCIGIIGDDGRCTVCDCTAPEGAAPEGALTADHRDGDSDDLDGSTPDFDDNGSREPSREPSHEGSDEASGFDPNRRLCSDDACIGVIGADDRCTECGKPAQG